MSKSALVSWRNRTAKDASEKDDEQLMSSIRSMSDWLGDVWRDVDPEQIDTPFYEYMISDAEATLDIYRQEAYKRGIEGV